LFKRHGVGFGVAHALAESAQAATGHAYIGGIDVAVHVEVGGVAVEPLANQVGQPAGGQNIGGAVECYSVVKGEPFAGFHFGANRDQTSVFNHHRHASKTRFEEENIGCPEQKE